MQILSTSEESRFWNESERSSNRDDHWFMSGANFRLPTLATYFETASFAISLSQCSSHRAENLRASLSYLSQALRHKR